MEAFHALLDGLEVVDEPPENARVDKAKLSALLRSTNPETAPAKETATALRLKRRVNQSLAAANDISADVNKYLRGELRRRQGDPACVEELERSANQMNISIDMADLSSPKRGELNLLPSTMRVAAGEAEESGTLYEGGTGDVLKQTLASDMNEINDAMLSEESQKPAGSERRSETARTRRDLLTASQALSREIDMMTERNNLKELYKQQQEIRARQLQMLRENNQSCYGAIKAKTQKVIQNSLKLQTQYIDDKLRMYNSEQSELKSLNEIEDLKIQIEDENDDFAREYQELQKKYYDELVAGCQSGAAAERDTTLEEPEQSDGDRPVVDVEASLAGHDGINVEQLFLPTYAKVQFDSDERVFECVIQAVNEAASCLRISNFKTSETMQQIRLDCVSIFPDEQIRLCQAKIRQLSGYLGENTRLIHLVFGQSTWTILFSDRHKYEQWLVGLKRLQTIE